MQKPTDPNDGFWGRTYSEFVRQVRKFAGLPEWEAEEAAAAVLCALESNFSIPISRLPATLRTLLAACPRHEHFGDRERHERSILNEIAHELDREPAEAEDIVHAVIAAVRSSVSNEDARHIADNLPEEVRDMWRRPMSDR